MIIKLYRCEKCRTVYFYGTDNPPATCYNANATPWGAKECKGRIAPLAQFAAEEVVLTEPT